MVITFYRQVLIWQSNNKAGLHCTFWNSLIEFLCTNFDGNLSSTLNPLSASKLDHYLSTFFEGLSETANKGEIFDQHMLNEKCKDQFIEKIVELFATQIPLSIFTNLFHQRFEKHSMLESTLEILQQFYIQMESEPDDLYNFPGDLSHKHYSIRDVARMLLFMVKLEKLYSMHPLECCITGT
jgi:hypothetical protein